MEASGRVQEKGISTAQTAVPRLIRACVATVSSGNDWIEPSLERRMGVMAALQTRVELAGSEEATVRLKVMR